MTLFKPNALNNHKNLKKNAEHIEYCKAEDSLFFISSFVARTQPQKQTQKMTYRY